MIPRYTLPEMGRVWSEENKFQKWLQVEIAVCEVLAEMGEIPQEELSQIQQKAGFSIDRIKEIEEVTRHDMIAFTTAVAEKVGPASRFIHFGLTSTDVVDTAQALQVKEASELIEKELLGLLSTLRTQALRYKQVPAIGRTHGIHAEPVTLGLKLAVWYSEMERNLHRFRRARETLEVGKLSGPVGSFSHLSPQVEEKVCQKLEIDFARVSTQTLQRDRHAEYLCTLAILGSTYDKVATEIRHLMRTEVQEVSEPFGSGQKGSSAMPHKRNPVTCENISGLSRLMRSNAMAALENIPLWHERDISHSSRQYDAGPLFDRQAQRRHPEFRGTRRADGGEPPADQGLDLLGNTFARVGAKRGPSGRSLPMDSAKRHARLGRRCGFQNSDPRRPRHPKAPHPKGSEPGF